MTANRKSTLVSLFVIVLFSILLSACNGEVHVSDVTAATVDSSEKATLFGVTNSIRTKIACGINEVKDIQAGFNADLENARKAANDNTLNALGATVDQWLDAEDTRVSCIMTYAEVNAQASK